jgi:hypothetical protein
MAADKTYCGNCNAQVTSDMNFCPVCGAALKRTAIPKATYTSKQRPRISLPWTIASFVLLFFYLYLIFAQPSTLAYILIGITLPLNGLWIILTRTSQKVLTKIFKLAFFGFALFVIVFASLGLYFLNYAGPIVPQVSYSNILDASLTSYLQTLEQSASFRFIQTEHFGTLTFQSLSVHSIYSNAPGGLEWAFYVGDLKCKLMIGQSGGQPYYYDLLNHITDSLPHNYPSNQEITKSFNQIDSLGLHWFYNQAVGEYQNAIGAKPVITDIYLDVAFNNVGNYQGITLVVTGVKAGLDNFGNKVYPTVFAVEFQPNGNILSSRNSPGL